MYLKAMCQQGTLKLTSVDIIDLYPEVTFYKINICLVEHTSQCVTIDTCTCTVSVKNKSENC